MPKSPQSLQPKAPGAVLGLGLGFVWTQGSPSCSCSTTCRFLPAEKSTEACGIGCGKWPPILNIDEGEAEEESGICIFVWGRAMCSLFVTTFGS